MLVIARQNTIYKSYETINKFKNYAFLLMGSIHFMQIDKTNITHTEWLIWL